MAVLQSDGVNHTSDLILRRASVAIATVTSTALDASNLLRGGSQVYSRNNILGTVSQSSGVPTGAIIEQGSNANGRFVKYADGTQICWHKQETANVSTNIALGTLFRTDDLPNPTFPAAFSPSGIISYAMTGNRIGSAPSAWLVQNSAPSTTVLSNNGGIRGISAVSIPAGNFSLSYVAVGRWF
jgi:hypothetical protein